MTVQIESTKSRNRLTKAFSGYPVLSNVLKGKYLLIAKDIFVSQQYADNRGTVEKQYQATQNSPVS
jgi:hypothetical protein